MKPRLSKFPRKIIFRDIASRNVSGLDDDYFADGEEYV